MNAVLDLLSVDTIMFNILNYPVSYIEFIGTVFNLTSVWLVARKQILNWPVGLVGVLLFGILFYQINLYADLFEQIYFFITGIWGWLLWSNARKPKLAKEKIIVTKNSSLTNTIWIVVIIVGTLIGSYMMSNIHQWLPRLFPEPASLVLADTFTTVLSFVATILLMRRKLESWLLWIIVDIIAIWLYWHKGVPFISLLYGIFLVLAAGGFISWLKTYRREL